MGRRLVPRFVRRRRRGERGAVLVELAFVVPVLTVFILGMFEVGMMWSTSQSVVQASRSGGRTVSQLGQLATADQEALRAIVSTFGEDADQITRVVIYEYDESRPDGMPASCGTSALPTSGPGCNSYDATAITNVAVESFFIGDGGGDGCGSSGSSGASSAWCPTVRNDSQTSATEIGVRVEFEYEMITGFFGGGTKQLTQVVVMRVEPKTS